jgi:probable HAF family extracellular repeat protein
MQIWIPRSLRAVALSAALAIPGQFVQAQAPQRVNQIPQYYVISLGDPLGGPSAAAASINNIGWIAGDAYLTATTEHAELWLGVPLDLGTLGGANSAVGWPNKNNHGEIVGITETRDLNPLGEDWSCALANFPTITNHICFGFAWQDGAMSPLPPLAGGLDSHAAGINNRGQIVGWAENGVHESTCAPPQALQFEAVIWGPGSTQMTELPPLSGDLDGAATAINDQGEVVGISGICDQAVGRYTARHAVLWKNGSPTDLGNFDGGVAWNTPTAINRWGQVVGFANLPNTPTGTFNPVSFLWTKEHRIQQLPLLGGDPNNWAWGINSQSQVVGQSFGGASLRAFLYQVGEMLDLNSLIQPNSSLYLQRANDINDSGEIVGYASDATGAIVAFLAGPVDGGINSEHAAGARGEGSSQRVAPTTRRPLPGFGRFAVAAAGQK